MRLGPAVLVAFGIGMAVALSTGAPGGCVDVDCGSHEVPGGCCVIQPDLRLVPMLQGSSHSRDLSQSFDRRYAAVIHGIARSGA